MKNLLGSNSLNKKEEELIMSDEQERNDRCPKCSATGHGLVHEVDDKTKILYNDGMTTIYAKKFVCHQCGTEWSTDGLLIDGFGGSQTKEPTSDDIVSAFLISVKQDNPGQFETFSESDWRCAARYMLQKHGMIANDSIDAEYMRYAEFMDFLDNEAKKKVPGYEE